MPKAEPLGALPKNNISFSSLLNLFIYCWIHTMHPSLWPQDRLFLKPLKRIQVILSKHWKVLRKVNITETQTYVFSRKNSACKTRKTPPAASADDAWEMACFYHQSWWPKGMQIWILPPRHLGPQWISKCGLRWGRMLAQIFLSLQQEPTVKPHGAVCSH